MKTYALAVLVAFALAPASGHAQQYPTKPIRLIVPFPAGGQTDVVARTVALKLSDVFGQTVVVDNRPGAAGSIGVDLAVKAPADGYTMVQVSTSYAGNVALYKLSYDPVKDVVPVIMIGEIANMVVVNPSGSFHSIRDVIDYAKANPGKINFASGGTGSGNHLATEQFAQMAGIKMTHVPYKGSTAGTTDLMSGQIQLIFSGITGMIPHHKAKRVRGIAVTSAKRNKAVPDLPTVGETIPGYESVSWSAILGQKGLPKNVVARWNTELNRVLKMPDVQARMDSLGLDIVGGTPEHLREVLVQDIEKWKRVVKTANIKL
ncbi:MAG TPA: tripartite tricarboxylate transporter substrate binding protein [Burkholderiales bacterium]|nr:tripartite tricarboxylate transporter substrate binding protein [Burkholderiales bacterium]